MLRIYTSVLVALFLLFQSFSRTSNSVSYSRFRDLVAAGRVTDVKLGASHIEGHYTSGGKHVAFRTTALPVDDPTLVPDLRKQHVRIEGKQDSQVGSVLLTWVLPLGI